MAGVKRKAWVLKRPATPPPIRIRKNVGTLSASDPVITFYGKAIAEMKKSGSMFKATAAQDPNLLGAKALRGRCEHFGAVHA